MTWTTRDALWIIWKGEERPGVYLYGLWPLHGAKAPPFPLDAWMPGVEWGESRLHGDAWKVYEWSVRVPEWPSPTAFVTMARATLSALIEGGARVAWIGLEANFCDPPSLFTIPCMSGLLLALTDDGEWLGTLDLDEPPIPLNEAELARLREASRGLATSL